MQQSKKIFALDIGTRSVVGIVLEQEDETFRVIEMISEEHKERAMLDGQIHDVPAVSAVITKIKETLEKNHGTIEKVCVAAAGRALKTKSASASIHIKGKPLLKKEDIVHLELSAVQKAQSIVAEEEHDHKSYHYYCVGYSVLHYHLDGEDIGSLIDQQGEEASVEVISTFLPRVVVESLIAALNRSGLEMEALTLEPIAAINVLIPPSMRRLNVALVDIGAGTSDIAITNMGTITAYGMVPTAGDEITEALSDQFLLDFPVAEKVKRTLYQSDTVTIQDILGFETEYNKSDVVEKIVPAIDHLSHAISKEILLLNSGKPPQAVMLVGGGSLTPELTQKIAEAIELPHNRVAVRGVDAIQNLSIPDDIHRGPELVTPIGIAIAAKQSPVQYVTTYVNDQPIRLFEMKVLTVGDCLLAAGQKISKLYGKPGPAYMVKVNEQVVTIPGQYGEPPTITINGKQAELDSPIINGDKITVVKGKDGAEPLLKIIDLIDPPTPKSVLLEGKQYDVSIHVRRNGKEASLQDTILDRDEIEVQFIETIKDVLTKLGFQSWIEELKPFHVVLNKKETFFPKFSGNILVNDIAVKPSYKVQDHDRITITKSQNPTLREVLDKKHLQDFGLSSITVLFNNTKVVLEKQNLDVSRNGKPISNEDIVHSGDELRIKKTEAEGFIFQDLFRFVEIEMPENASGKFVLLRNGEEIGFHDPIHSGDHLEIYWPLATNVEK